VEIDMMYCVPMDEFNDNSSVPGPETVGRSRIVFLAGAAKFVQYLNPSLDQVEIN
jgi:hypothetical protein